MPGIVAGKNDNRAMPRCPAAALALLLAACSPAFDWRDVRDEPSGLRMTFPCKPDHAIRGEVTRETDFVPRGALGLDASKRVWVKGRRADGSAVQGQAAYFARGSRVYQAVIYSNAIRDEVADTFFTGLLFE